MYRRYCSYDMPGTGWSDPIVQGYSQDYITQAVMDAMGETGPFVMMGSMDGGHERIYRYALDHPESVRALVPVNFNNGTEFTDRIDAGLLAPGEEAEAYARDTLRRRMITGDIYNFLGVSFGLMEYFIPPNPLYVPAARAVESLFLNEYNEKQWVTNSHMLYTWVQDPVGTGQLGTSLYNTQPGLSMDIPILGYALGQTDSSLNQLCTDSNYPLDSSDCALLHSTYTNNMHFNEAVVARNPRSKLIVCWDCYAPYNNGFIINQYSNIPWFTSSLMAELSRLEL